jgi:hypothetical protein
MMNKIVKLKFKNWQVVKFSGSYYVNFAIEDSLFVVIKGVKYYKIKKEKLRSLGMKRFEEKKEEDTFRDLDQAEYEKCLVSIKNLSKKKNITKGIVLKNKILQLGFKSSLYKADLDRFVSFVNLGAKIDTKIVMHELLRKSCYYCGLSSTYRTLFYDFAWAVLDINPQFWNEEEKENGFSDMSGIDFYPDFDDKGYDTDTLEYGEYFIAALNLLKENEMDETMESIFCYGLFIFMERWKFQFNKEVMTNSMEVIKEEEENCI